MKKGYNSLAERLDKLLTLAETKAITGEVIIKALAGKGQAVLLIIFSLPFCLPIQIPGFSTPFGILIAFIGLRIAFGHRVWFPNSLLQYKIPYKTLKKIASITIKITDKIGYFVSTRLTWLVQNSTLHILHGLTITILALVLALPLPIPFTNLFVAFPILAFGLAFLEDDGYMIILAYFLTLLCFLYFGALVFFGKEAIKLLSLM